MPRSLFALNVAANLRFSAIGILGLRKSDCQQHPQKLLLLGNFAILKQYVVAVMNQHSFLFGCEVVYESSLSNVMLDECLS